MPLSSREQARRFAKTSREGFEAVAGTFESLREDEWSGPTGCAKWDMRVLAGHIVGEAVWFANVVRGVTRGDKPHSSGLYEELNRLPPMEMAARTTSAAREIEDSIGEATGEQLEEPADMGWTKMPLWRAARVSTMEAVLHEWDTRARREKDPTIPASWANIIAESLVESGPFLAHQNALCGNEGTYALEVDEPIGPVTIQVLTNRVQMTEGPAHSPDLVLRVTADQYVRLITGRLDGKKENVAAEGDRDRVEALTHVFAGIANG